MSSIASTVHVWHSDRFYSLNSSKTVFIFPIFQVQSMNILKTLFRDSSTGSEILKYAEVGLILSIEGFTSHSWSVRNAAQILLGETISMYFRISLLFPLNWRFMRTGWNSPLDWGQVEALYTVTSVISVLYVLICFQNPDALCCSENAASI